jgi:hypothetical protein
LLRKISRIAAPCAVGERRGTIARGMRIGEANAQ